jgi:hypothetical protein
MPVRPQIFGEMMRGVAFARSVTDHDKSAAQSDGVRDLCVIGGLFRRPLTLFPGLVFVRQIMEEMVWIVGPDDVFGSLLGGDIDVKDPRAMMICNDQKIWRGRIGIGGGSGWTLRRHSRSRQKTPELEHIVAGEILRVGPVRDVALAGDFKYKFSVGLRMGVPNLLDESDDVSPLKILRDRMTENSFERAAVRPCQR